MDDFSEEFLEEERRGRTKRIALIAILSAITLVGAIIAGLEIYGFIMHDKRLQTPEKGLNLKLPMKLGPEDAKVKIEATIPQSGCLDSVVAFLLELQAWRPDGVRLELYSMHEPDGQAILKKYNAECASVFINGNRTISYMKDGVEHDVVFTGSIGSRFEFEDGWGNHYDFSLTGQQWNPNIPWATFRFTPPAGTRID